MKATSRHGPTGDSLKNGRDVGNQARVLVVDDERPILGLIESFFTAKGLECQTTSDPANALEAVQARPFDVVVTDIHMKGFSGVELLEKVKEVDPSTLVILMTGRPTVDSAVRSVRARAYDYVTKPFELEDLYGVVERALEKQRLERENTALKDTLALYRITQAVAASVDEHEVLRMVLQTAERELDAERVQLFRVGDDGTMEPWGETEDREASRLAARIADRVLAGDDEVHTTGQESPRPAAGAPILGPGDEILGALVALRRPGDHPFDSGSLKVLLVLAGNAGAAITSARQSRRAIETRAGLVAANAATVGALVSALDAREHETRTHSIRVTQYALRLAREIDYPSGELAHLKFGSMLHDIGKIGVSDSILLKPGPLTEDEWQEIRRHPMIGYQILKDISFLTDAAKIVLYHQERYDGTGYPFGLEGNDIPLGARLFAVVDTFDAMTSDRPYRSALTYDHVVEEVHRENGSQFDPEIVEAFLRVDRDEWTRIREETEEARYNWEELSMRGGFVGVAELSTA